MTNGYFTEIAGYSDDIQKNAKQRSASVAGAKENFSALLRDVERDRSEIIVKRRGVAIAKIVPFTEIAPTSGYGWMKCSAHEVGDIVGPTGEEWDVTGE